MPNNLKLNILRQENEIIIEMTGDLDISSNPQFIKEVEEEFDRENANMVFEMRNLTYIDSTGLGAFMTLYRKVKDTDYTISLRNLRDNIKKIFTITELDKIFRID